MTILFRYTLTLSLAFLGFGLGAQEPADMNWTADGLYLGDQIQAYFDVDGTILVPDGDEFVAAFRPGDFVQVGPAVPVNEVGGTFRFANITIYSEYSCLGFEVPDCATNKATNVIPCTGGSCGNFVLIIFDPDANGGSGGYFGVADSANPTEYDYDNSNVVGHSVLGPLNTPALTIAGPALSSIADFLTAFPVSFASFTGSQAEKNVKLSWTTASESENESFTIERSITGEAFYGIGEVAGAGNSEVAIDYGFTDESPESGLNFYRLRQNDSDGNVSYSSVLVVDFDGADAGAMSVSPNPAEDQFSVRLSGNWSAESVSGKLIEASGRLIKDWQQLPGTSTTIDLNGVAAGVYQVMMTDGKNRLVQRVVVR